MKTIQVKDGHRDWYFLSYWDTGEREKEGEDEHYVWRFKLEKEHPQGGNLEFRDLLFEDEFNGQFDQEPTAQEMMSQFLYRMNNLAMNFAFSSGMRIHTD